MKIWNEEQIVNLARRAYERRVAQKPRTSEAEEIEFREGVAAVLKEVLGVSWAEAERRLLKGNENLKEPKS